MSAGKTRLAVVSDTHNRVGRLRWVADDLGRRGITTVVHCGDITSEEVVDVLADFQVHWALGNCDFDERGLRSAMSRWGHRCHGVRGEITEAGRKIAFTHGHRFEVLQALINGGEHDFVFHGHTHLRRDEVVAGTRVICPGALHQVEPPSFAVVDLRDGGLEWVDVPRST